MSDSTNEQLQKFKIEISVLRSDIKRLEKANATQVMTFEQRQKNETEIDLIRKNLKEIREKEGLMLIEEVNKEHMKTVNEDKQHMSHYIRNMLRNAMKDLGSISSESGRHARLNFRNVLKRLSSFSQSNQQTSAMNDTASSGASVFDQLLNPSA